MISRAVFLWYLVCFTLPRFAPGADLPPEVVQLAAIKRNMAKLLARVPDYTCAETVQRYSRPPAAERFRLLDTLRWEVAYVGGREVYSRPGATRFDDRRVSDMVNQGLTSDGDFAIQSRAVFLDYNARISFSGTETLNGHDAHRYDYRISLFVSGWTLRFQRGSSKVAEHGAFWTDAKSLDLLRIDRYADEIPPELYVAAVYTQLDYGKARLGGEFVSIPRASDTLVTEVSGAQSRNVAGFSQCHPVRGESSISFDSDVPAQSRPIRSVQQVELPANLLVSLELTEKIDPSQNVEGDPITARVSKDVFWKKQLVIPAGAIATGRVRSLQTDDAGWHVGLEFVELEFPDRRVIFQASLDSAGHSPTLKNLPGVGDVYLGEAHKYLERGFRMSWRTFSTQKTAK